MELDRRVKTLEQEMKILKNQIQTTLREIQEQVLIHYYPSLRSDSYTEKNESTEAAETSNGVEEPQGSFAAKPKVKMVSLDDIREKKKHISHPSTNPDNSSDGAEQKIGHGMAEIAHWMGDSLVEIGPEKTGRMIEMKVEDGTISPQAKDKLFQLLTMFGDGDVDRTVVKEMTDAFLRLNKLYD